MRSRALSLWLFLLFVLAAQTVAYSFANSLAAYSRRALYAHFTTETAAIQDVKGLPYSELINQAGKTYGVSPELVAAVIKAESSFQARALSKAGAYGLMQVIPGTWRLVNNQALICHGRHDGECGSDCFYNPELNIAVGTYYLGQLVRRYNSHVELAVAAYNAGPGAVDKYGGIPPYAETTEYVERVVDYWYQLSGRLPPAGLAAGTWTKITYAVGWSMVMTVSALVLTGRYLLRRHRGFHWR